MMRKGIRLGRIAGIEVFADWSLLLIFFIIAFGLATLAAGFALDRRHRLRR